MSTDFRSISTPEDLAGFFGLSYEELAKVIYGIPERHRYISFTIPKNRGAPRRIDAPCRQLKTIQSTLKDALDEVYVPRASTHGFVKDHSVVTNAKSHLGKSFVFNIDLSNYFGCIHFGRVRNLFQAPPLRFKNSVATVLAQICCFRNGLPQGAPTSPVIANMVTRKLDRELQVLARRHKASYTRYVDDITFSFTCSRFFLPKEIVEAGDRTAEPGRVLTHLIEKNGFKINHEKVRLAGKYGRMEVTGITVNQFTNVTRRYVRQIGSMLYAWEKFDYEAAQRDFAERHGGRHRASGSQKSLSAVIRGKLAYLRSVRGGDDLVFAKLAARYNALGGDAGHTFHISTPVDLIDAATRSLWVVESFYEEGGERKADGQGTGFMLGDIGLVTCAHCVLGKDGEPRIVEAYRPKSESKRWAVKVLRADKERDIALCSLERDGYQVQLSSVSLSDAHADAGLQLTLVGFPNHQKGSTHIRLEYAVARTQTYDASVQRFDVGPTTIYQGASGSPLLDAEGRVVAMAQRGVTEDGGASNSCLHHEEIRQFVEGDSTSD